jgi:hypothetical protein
MLIPKVACFILGAVALFHEAEDGYRQQPLCDKRPDTLAVGSTARQLAGEYHFVILGTAGAAEGKSASGTLRLWSPPESVQTVRRFDGKPNRFLMISLIGTAAIDLSKVGGLVDGELTSSDPLAPGVAVEELNATFQGKPFTEITLRLGSAGNRRGVLRFDGPYNALYVDRFDSTGFAGRWHASLGYTDYKAEGHFCAWRR